MHRHITFFLLDPLAWTVKSLCLAIVPTTMGPFHPLQISVRLGMESWSHGPIDAIAIILLPSLQTKPHTAQSLNGANDPDGLLPTIFTLETKPKVCRAKLFEVYCN